MHSRFSFHINKSGDDFYRLRIFVYFIVFDFGEILFIKRRNKNNIFKIYAKTKGLSFRTSPYCFV